VYRALGLEPAAVEVIPSEGVRAAFLRAGGVQIELLESLQPDGVIARFIERRGEGLHHLAFATDDIRAAMTLLQSSGLELVDSEPRRGAHGRFVAFVHPRTANGLLIELVQESGSSPGTASQRD
jgi:methylmalonyl-CoA/ethylmalonyl-CoA epimerase